MFINKVLWHTLIKLSTWNLLYVFQFYVWILFVSETHACLTYSNIIKSIVYFICYYESKNHHTSYSHQSVGQFLATEGGIRVESFQYLCPFFFHKKNNILLEWAEDLEGGECPLPPKIIVCKSPTYYIFWTKLKVSQKFWGAWFMGCMA